MILLNTDVRVKFFSGGVIVFIASCNSFETIGSLENVFQHTTKICEQLNLFLYPYILHTTFLRF